MTSVLLLTKTNCAWSAHVASDLSAMAGVSVTPLFGDWGQPLPEMAKKWSGDIIISYLSRWIVPLDLLERARLAVNFHPAPPEYPGVGGINWALYENRKRFGVTCHHMAPKVDCGPIIAVKRFDILPDYNVDILVDKCNEALRALFNATLPSILHLEPPQSDEQWGTIRRTRKQQNELATIHSGMSADEVKRRLRATWCRAFPTLINIDGECYKLIPLNISKMVSPYGLTQHVKV